MEFDHEQPHRWGLGANLRTAASEGRTGYQDPSGGHFIFTAYDAQTGRPLYTAGGTYKVDGSSYTEHMDFASDKIADLVGKDQSFTLQVEGDVLTQIGILSNGKALSERFRRLGPTQR